MRQIRAEMKKNGFLDLGVTSLPLATSASLPAGAGAITAAWDWSEGRADQPIGALSENVMNATVDVNLNNGAAKSDVGALF